MAKTLRLPIAPPYRPTDNPAGTWTQVYGYGPLVDRASQYSVSYPPVEEVAKVFVGHRVEGTHDTLPITTSTASLNM